MEVLAERAGQERLHDRVFDLAALRVSLRSLQLTDADLGETSFLPANDAHLPPSSDGENSAAEDPAVYHGCAIGGASSEEA